MNKNIIPRKFNCIIGKMLIDTNANKINDILHIYKNDVSTGYLALNVRTQKYYQCFVSMLRDTECFELIEVNK